MTNRLVLVVTGILGCWALAYAGFWLAHSGCFEAFTSACLDAPIEPARAFIMFEWVYGYQTLLAGILTFIAGLSVVFVYAIQRRQTAADALRSLRESRIATLVEVRLALLAIRDALEFNNYEALDLGRQRLHASAVDLGRFAPSFSNLVLQIWSLVQVGRPPVLDPRFGAEEERRLARNVAAALAGDAAKFFYGERRLVNQRGDWAFSPMRYGGASEKVHPLVRALFKFVQS